MATYRVLDDMDSEYRLAEAVPKTVRALRALQVKSTYYSDTERYHLLQEMLWTDDIEEEENNDGTVTFEVPDPEISSLDFLEQAAALLFPSAPVEEHADHIVYRQVREALENFTSAFERPRDEPSDLPDLSILSQMAATETSPTASQSPQTTTES